MGRSINMAADSVTTMDKAKVKGKGIREGKG